MMRLLLGIAFLLVAYVISLYYAAFVGLQHNLGVLAALLIMFVSFYSRFFVVIVIAGYIGIVQTWQWHWFLGLIYLSPALLITLLLLQSRGYANQWRRSYQYFNDEADKSTPQKKKVIRNEDDVIDVD